MSEPKKLSRWGQLRERRWFRWSTDVLFFVVLMSGVMWFQTRSHVGSGTLAPALRLAALQGEAFDLAESKRPTVIFFWAPWCGVCNSDAHNIDDLMDAVGDEVNVVSVALSYERLQDVKDFVSKNKVQAPVLLGDNQTAIDWRVDAFPTVYIVNKDGEISHSMVGYTTEFGVRARLATLGVF